MKELLLAFTVCGLLAAQEKVDQATGARLRSEEVEKSQIMRTLHMLTDRYGPRVTGTPNHEAAAKWVVKQLTDWGLKNARLEPWDFGHPGWSNERASAFILSPAAVWHVANRDEMVPRFTKETMPAAPPVAGQ